MTPPDAPGLDYFFKVVPQIARSRSAGPGPTGERLQISIIAGTEFRWSLWSGGAEILAGLGDRYEVPGMVQATKILVNTELGVPPDVGGAVPSIN